MVDQQWANAIHVYITLFFMASDNSIMSLFPSVANSQYKHKIKWSERQGGLAFLRCQPSPSSASSTDVGSGASIGG
jgi:hypothetical protein